MFAVGQKKFGACLADDMGLGKTLQTLTLLQKVKELNEHKTTAKKKQESQLSLFSNEYEMGAPASLIIVPTSLVHNWNNEIKKFTPKLKTYKHIGTQRKRHQRLENNR